MSILQVLTRKKALTSEFPFLVNSILGAKRLIKSIQTLPFKLVQNPNFEAKFRVHRHKSLTRRRLGDSDPELQELKAQNLAIACQKFDQIIIGPRDTFSFWKLLGQPSRENGFGDGMLISNGIPTKGIGGGLCQMANLLYWLVLHSPLIVKEHHHHSMDLFPDSGRILPFGSGASVFWSFVDLQFYNPTDATFKLNIFMDETHLNGIIYSDRDMQRSYKVVEEEHKFYKRQDGEIRRTNKLYKITRQEPGGKVLSKELITFNDSKVFYEVSEDKLD